MDLRVTFMLPPVLPVPSLLLPPSLEGASVWASDSSTQWLIVVTLICVRLHESVQDEPIKREFPLRCTFTFALATPWPGQLQVKQSFCSQYATMLQQLCKYILHWMRIWAFARKWLVTPWTRAALAVPCTYVDLCNRRDRHCNIVASAGCRYIYIRQKSPLQKGNPWK